MFVLPGQPIPMIDYASVTTICSSFWRESDFMHAYSTVYNTNTHTHTYLLSMQWIVMEELFRNKYCENSEKWKNLLDEKSLFFSRTEVVSEVSQFQWSALPHTFPRNRKKWIAFENQKVNNGKNEDHSDVSSPNSDMRTKSMKTTINMFLHFVNIFSIYLVN